MARIVVSMLGEQRDRVADVKGLAVHHAGVGAPAAGLAKHPLDGQSRALGDLPRARLGGFEGLEDRRSVVPGGVGRVGRRRCRRAGPRPGSRPSRMKPSSRERVSISSTTLWKASSDQATASILLTATMIERTPSSAAMQRWRRVCSLRPEATSRTTRARSAVEAPVAMLLVYCTCPGQSAMMNLRVGRRRVAIGHVDGDALFAFGAQSVGDEAEVEVADAALLRRGGDGVELVVEELARVDEQSTDQRRLAVVDRADRGEA